MIELLIVVLTIALLAGILLPTLGRVRQSATGAECGSNLRQMAAAWSTYAQNNNGYSCPARVDGSTQIDLGNGPFYRPRWYDLLGAQMRMFAFVTPPSASNDALPIDNDFFLDPGAAGWRNGRNYVYGYNYQFLGNSRTRTGQERVNFPVPISRLHLSGTVLAADSMGTAAGKGAAFRTAHLDDGGHDLFAIGNHGYTIDPPRLTASSDYADSDANAPADRSGPDPRHAGRANAAFCDGHVELTSLQDLGYGVAGDDSITVDGAGVSNDRFSGTRRDDDPPSAS